jgi:hypothetical protein
MEELFTINEDVRLFLSKLDYSNESELHKTILYLSEKGIFKLQCVFLLMEYGHMSFERANSYVSNFEIKAPR